MDVYIIGCLAAFLAGIVATRLFDSFKKYDGAVYYNLEAEDPRNVLTFEVHYTFIQKVCRKLFKKKTMILLVKSIEDFQPQNKR